MSSPARKSPELSDKSKKYDRQIRLWGDHGQNLLENAEVCLINATALGTEILKGIVLAGVGGFRIVDGGFVTEEDVGCNFFLDDSCITKSRAQCAMELLQELNPDVVGDYCDENIEMIVKRETHTNFFQVYDVVIATCLKEKTLIELSQILWQLNIPLIYCRSIGFMGSARLQLQEHYVIETHPDNKQNDLRLEKPFPTLQKHLEDTELSIKQPWLIVLYTFLNKWRSDNDNRFPKTYKEKCELRELIRNGMEKDEENYEEAIKAVNTSFGGGQPGDSLKQLFDDNKCINLTQSSTSFWIMIRALKEFIIQKNDGYLPVAGILPDMTADTNNYITLQNIYRNQAQCDIDCVYRLIKVHLKNLKLPCEMISEKEVKLFCRESAYLSIVRGSKISDEYENQISHQIAAELEMPNTLIPHYIIMRALDKFFSEHGYFPGEYNVETDTCRIKNIISKLMGDRGFTIPVSDDLAHELCRYGGSELHSVSAFLGGCIAHEIIKLITKQYKPFDNTLIYNSISAETSIYKL